MSSTNKPQLPPAKMPEPMSDNELAGLIATVVIGVVVLFVCVGYSDYQASWQRRNDWEGYASRNPEVEVIGVVQGQYGPSKWHSSQLMVEVRGTKTGETKIIREKDDRVQLEHLPQKGQIWRTSIVDGPGGASYCFTFKMELLSRDSGK